jgi:hypothetical protein
MKAPLVSYWRVKSSVRPLKGIALIKYNAIEAFWLLVRYEPDLNKGRVGDRERVEEGGVRGRVESVTTALDFVVRRKSQRSIDYHAHVAVHYISRILFVLAREINWRESSICKSVEQKVNLFIASIFIIKTQSFTFST